MKEVVREAVRKEQIVPGKIRVISIFLALIVATVVTTAVVMGDVQRKERAVQEHLAEEVLRFHVLANSDSRTDQAVKMEVRDAVLSYLKEVLPEKGKQQLKKVLTEEEYSEVTAGSKFQIRWFFWKEK